ncbi:major capsid protein [Microviridae sp.]|nr:major capsid protein [Microviridae sp.]
MPQKHRQTRASQRSVMSHQFSQVPQAQIPRSSFDRSHGLKTTFDAGYLVPIFVDEALPGDTFNLRANLFGRLATPIKPIMDNLFLETFFFFIPNRLVFEDWQKLNGEQENPGDSTDYTIPVLVDGDNINTGPQTLWDYMGCPILQIPTNLPVNALHFRAYNLVYNEWFRDQNLQDSVPVPTDTGPDDLSDNYTLLRRGKRHDYFTACLPWPQKGDPVTVPLGGTAPLIADAGAGFVRMNAVGGDTTNLHTAAAPGNVSTNPAVPGNVNIWADLASATGITINDLRQSFQIQKLLERDARGGTRYTEIVRSHFGVTSPDARLQRPEFLGGGSQMININPVAQTSDQLSGGPGVESPQGNLAAFGTVSAQGHGFTKSFTEHGVIIGLVNVRADLTYQQGLNRMWSRQGRFDFYWPALSHIGEQAVLNKEIYAQGILADDDVFGYQERFAEYRYKPSMITGKFRSEAPTTLDYWHLSQDFANLPVLGDTFIQDNPPIDRVVAVPDEPHFLLDIFFKFRCARPMPLYGVPGLIDHF